MKERLPDRTDPYRLAQRGAVLSGEMPLAGMSRLAGSLVECEGVVEVDLRFGKDERGVAMVAVSLRTELSLICQNCLEALRYPVAVETVLGLVGSEAEAERLPEAYEPLLVGDEPFYIKDLVEDELILALPIIPRHPESSCLDKGGDRKPDETPGDRDGKENPFTVLKRLKKDPDEE